MRAKYAQRWQTGRAVNYLQMLVKLVHQAGEELVGVLLFSDIQLLVPHLENLQHDRMKDAHTHTQHEELSVDESTQ